MQKETRTSVQIWSAVGMLIAGVTLSFIAFFTPPVGEISNSVLAFFAQCLVYAGSIFGVGIYINSKFGEIRHDIEKKQTP